LLQIKKTKNKFSNYIDELSNIKTLKQFLENITSSSKDIHELILKLKTHIR
jgi:predicted CopG family antitoxin